MVILGQGTVAGAGDAKIQSTANANAARADSLLLCTTAVKCFWPGRETN